MKLSNRINAIEGSKTARFIPLLEKLRAQGRPVISLAIGEPAADTPTAVIQATVEALQRQETRYSGMAGLEGLRASLAAGFDTAGPENIVIFNGSKQALFSAFQVICNQGDEVIVPLPCWVSFGAQIKLAGGVPVYVDTCNHQLDLAAIEAAITRRTRAILINSPNNPSGAVYPARDLARIAELAEQHDLWIVSDEAYAFFVYDELVHASLDDLPGVRKRLILTRSFSKHFAMTGFRVGYALAPEAVASAMIRLQSQTTGNVCTFAQHGALAALAMDETLLHDQRNDLQRKRDLAFDKASQLFDCVRPQGAFYLFPDVRRHLRSGENSGEFSARLLERAGVAVVPGEDFGVDGHVRICFAAPEDQLLEAFQRISEVL